MNALEQVKGKVGIEARQACWDARESMKKKLSMSGLANSFALQQSLASGEDMKKRRKLQALLMIRCN